MFIYACRAYNTEFITLEPPSAVLPAGLMRYGTFEFEALTWIGTYYTLPRDVGEAGSATCL